MLKLGGAPAPPDPTIGNSPQNPLTQDHIPESIQNAFDFADRSIVQPIKKPIQGVFSFLKFAKFGEKFVFFWT